MQRSNQSYRVGIVGIGARTPVGLTAHSSAAAVRAGISRIGDHPFFIDKAGQPMSVAMDFFLPPELDGPDRFFELALPALREAIRPVETFPNGQFSFPLFFGIPEPRPGLAEGMDRILTEKLKNRKRLTLPFTDVVTFPRGHSAGLLALEAGWKYLQEGLQDFCLVGGVDTYLEAETLEWIDEGGQLKSGENRSGFFPGEGASFCLLASADAIAKLRLEVLGWVVAVASSREKNRIKTETICIGKGLTEAITGVTQKLRLPDEMVDYTICDMNGEPYRSEEFMYAVLRTHSALKDHTKFQTPADCWGDVGAASGPLMLMLGVASTIRGFGEGPRILIWNSSEGGDRAAALLDTGRVSLE